MVKAKAEEPFTVYRMMPRMPVPFSNCCLQTSGVSGNLLILERDSSADFFEFFGGLRDPVVVASDCVEQHVDGARAQPVQGAANWESILVEAARSRSAFISTKGKLSLRGRITVDRSRIFVDAVKCYEEKPGLANHFSVSVHFTGEQAVDLGGVTRDFFSGFWEGAYSELFDGAALLTPACHSNVDMDRFIVLGRILSHGYLCCGFFPTRISFPVLAFALLGLSASISQETLVRAFSDFLSFVDRKTIALALDSSEFSDNLNFKVISVLSRFGCREVPTPFNLESLLCSLAKHQFRSQPFAALCALNAGVPEEHKSFWQAMGVERLQTIFDALTANPEKVLEKIREPEFSNANEQRIFGYLQQYVGEMKLEESKRFLRFVTGSSVVTVDNISVRFNALTGLARRPIAHTCSNMLELPHTYNTFVEFVEEFTVLLGNEEYCWSMNSL